MARVKYAVLSGPWDDEPIMSPTLFSSLWKAQQYMRKAFPGFGAIVKVAFLRDDEYVVRRGQPLSGELDEYVDEDDNGDGRNY